MDYVVFNALAKDRFDGCFDTLTSKSKEYARGGDRLHNFKRASLIDKETPERALWGMWKKHIVSIVDMIDDLNDGVLPLKSVLEAKCVDNINYTVLFEALIMERILRERNELDKDK